MIFVLALKLIFDIAAYTDWVVYGLEPDAADRLLRLSRKINARR